MPKRILTILVYHVKGKLKLLTVYLISCLVIIKVNLGFNKYPNKTANINNLK